MTTHKPAAVFKLGAIQAAVWRNHSEKGAYYNVTIVRRYLDGETWKSSTSFGLMDLPLVAKVADQAHSFIYRHRNETENSPEE